MNSLSDTFGEPIFAYTRAQAIADGVLVDVSKVLEPCPFKYPVAMTRAAYEATLAAGGHWVPCESRATPEEILDAGTGATEHLELPGGQDLKGRLHDVFQMILWKMQSAKGPTDRIDFEVLVDVRGDCRRTRVALYALCGPGDNAESVITILSQGED